MPALPIRFFRKACTIRISGELVSAWQVTYPPRAALRYGLGDARAGFSDRIDKDPFHTVPIY